MPSRRFTRICPSGGSASGSHEQMDCSDPCSSDRVLRTRSGARTYLSLSTMVFRRFVRWRTERTRRTELKSNERVTKGDEHERIPNTHTSNTDQSLPCSDELRFAGESRGDDLHAPQSGQA